MIKKSVLILTILILSIACDYLPKSAFLSIPFDDPSIRKVHIAVFDGPVSEENLIMTTNIKSDESKVEIPIGDNLSFLVVSEDTNGIAKHYKITPNQTIKSGKTTSLTFDLDPLDVTNINFNSSSSGVLSWKDVGASSYHVRGDTWNAAQIATTNTLLYNGSGISY